MLMYLNELITDVNILKKTCLTGSNIFLLVIGVFDLFHFPFSTSNRCLNTIDSIIKLMKDNLFYIIKAVVYMSVRGVAIVCGALV